MAAINSIADIFEDGTRDAIWNDLASGAGVTSESGGFLVCTPPTSNATTSSAGYFTATSYDLTGVSTFVKIPQIPTNDAAMATYFLLSKDGANNVDWVILNGTIYARATIATVTSVLNSATYNATTHKWLRIRETSGTIFWEYATDGATWLILTSLANPYAVTALSVQLKVISIVSLASPGAGKFDNFNFPPTNATLTAGKLAATALVPVASPGVSLTAAKLAATTLEQASIINVGLGAGKLAATALVPVAAPSGLASLAGSKLAATALEQSSVLNVGLSGGLLLATALVPVASPGVSLTAAKLAATALEPASILNVGLGGGLLVASALSPASAPSGLATLAAGKLGASALELAPVINVGMSGVVLAATAIAPIAVPSGTATITALKMAATALLRQMVPVGTTVINSAVMKADARSVIVVFVIIEPSAFSADTVMVELWFADTVQGEQWAATTSVGNDWTAETVLGNAWYAETEMQSGEALVHGFDGIVGTVTTIH